MKILLRLYKLLVSPFFLLLFGGGCRYTPTCSEYATEAFRKYNFFKALFLSTKRVLKCNPYAKGGYDPLL